MNFATDFYAENCVFTGKVNFNTPVESFGVKMAVGCVFGGDIPQSLSIVGSSGGLSESEVKTLIESYIDSGVTF